MNSRPLQRALLTEELVAITETVEHALVLHQFLYWMHRKNFEAYMQECTARARAQDPGGDPEEGWIYKKAGEMAEEIMVGSRRTIARRMADLVKLGYLSERQNPNSGWDQTRQYRLNLAVIERALQEEGYSLQTLIQGRYWPLFEELLYEAHKIRKPNKSLTKTANKASGPNGQADHCNGHVGRSNGQTGHAISETTTETTTERGHPAQKSASEAPTLKAEAKPLADSFRASGAELSDERIRVLNRWAERQKIDDVQRFAQVVQKDYDGKGRILSMEVLLSKYREATASDVARATGEDVSVAETDADDPPQTVSHSTAAQAHHHIRSQISSRAKLSEHFDHVGEGNYRPATVTARAALNAIS